MTKDKFSRITAQKIEELRKQEEQQHAIVTALGVKHHDFMQEWQKLNEIRSKIEIEKNKERMFRKDVDMVDINVTFVR